MAFRARKLRSKQLSANEWEATVHCVADDFKPWEQSARASTEAEAYRKAEERGREIWQERMDA